MRVGQRLRKDLRRSAAPTRRQGRWVRRVRCSPLQCALMPSLSKGGHSHHCRAFDRTCTATFIKANRRSISLVNCPHHMLGASRDGQSARPVHQLGTNPPPSSREGYEQVHDHQLAARRVGVVARAIEQIPDHFSIDLRHDASKRRITPKSVLLDCPGVQSQRCRVAKVEHQSSELLDERCDGRNISPAGSANVNVPAFGPRRGCSGVGSCGGPERLRRPCGADDVRQELGGFWGNVEVETCHGIGLDGGRLVPSRTVGAAAPLGLRGSSRDRDVSARGDRCRTS